MPLRVVGAGIGRTGTTSLKAALERLLGAPSYHMMEVGAHPEHVPVWQAAADDQAVDWERLYAGYAATVDWPAASFWRETANAFPDSIVLLSTRRDADAWWKSASETILRGLRDGPPVPEMADWHRMVMTMLERRFTPDWDVEAAAKAAYLRHNDEVRAGVAPGRLVEWQPGDGWEPLCAALGLPVPDDEFPHSNTTEQFRAMRGWS
jgi:hypothetical protein